MIAAADKIGRTPRGEGESAFPDFGTLELEVKRTRRRRLDEEEAREQSQEDRHIAEDRRLNPDKYITFEELAAIVFERRRAKAGE